MASYWNIRLAMKTNHTPLHSVELTDSSAPTSQNLGIDTDRIEVLQSQMHPRALLDNVPVAIYCCDASGRLTLFNGAAVELWGRSPQIGTDSWCGSHRMFTVDGSPLALDRCPMALTLLEQRDLGVAEAVVERPDGSRRNVLAYPRLLFGPKGEVLGAINVVIDITERKRLENQLKEADQRKDEFLAMLAHELRNPLAPIRSAVEILTYGQPSELQIGQAVEMIDRQTTHLTSIVDDLLDVARITHRRVTLNKTKVDLAEILASAVDIVVPEIDMRGLRLTVEQPQYPVALYCDRTRLAQMLGNLLNNAAKYNHASGAIFLGVRVENEDLLITVRDTGIGIAKPMLDRVFDLFAQDPKGVTQQNGGLGIGLSVVKAMAELHGGSVSAASDGEGCGSVFSLQLPIVTTPTQPVPIRPVVNPPRRQKIMIVDDNLDAAEAMKILLELQGHEITVAHDANQTLLAATQGMPDVYLIDIGLPGMNGHELARELLKLPCNNPLRMIALTGFGQPDDRRRSAEAGFDEHMVKPITLDALLKCLTDDADAVTKR
jgi:PAS domain S-box-containing protein